MMDEARKEHMKGSKWVKLYKEWMQVPSWDREDEKSEEKVKN